MMMAWKGVSDRRADGLPGVFALPSWMKPPSVKRSDIKSSRL